MPLTYQPMIGAIPNTSRIHGITAATVSHNKSEKIPNTMAVAASPIGAGVFCFSVDMASIAYQAPKATTKSSAMGKATSSIRAFLQAVSREFSNAGSLF